MSIFRRMNLVPFRFLLLFLLPGFFLSVSWKKISVEDPKTREAEQNTFWTISSKDGIRKWTIVGDSVVGGGEVVDEMNDKMMSSGAGLAYCTTPESSTNLMLLIRDDDSYFTTVPTTGGKHYDLYGTARDVNAGGYGSFLYIQHYVSNGSENSALLRWRNGKLSVVAKLDDDEEFEVADLAVDTLGRAWFLTGRSSDEYFSTKNLRLCGYSPDGRKVASIPVEGISPNHAYGFMLIGGKFYIGFGSSNERFPGTLVPLIFSEGKMKPGKPIPFTADAHDLASKHPGVPSNKPKQLMDCNNQVVKMK